MQGFPLHVTRWEGASKSSKKNISGQENHESGCVSAELSPSWGWNTICSRVPHSLSRKQVARSSRLWLGKCRGGCTGLPMASTRRCPCVLDTENRGSSQKEAHYWQQDSNTYWPVRLKSQEHRARDLSHNWRGAKVSQSFRPWVFQCWPVVNKKKTMLH